MPGAVQTALMIGPLAAYFFVQGAWHRGRRPRVIPGQIDFSLLALGLAALVGFGPIGHLLVALVPSTAEIPARLTLLAALWLVVLLTAPSAYRRLMVYGVDPDDLDCALGEALHEEIPGDFARTLRGFEDVKSRRGLNVTVRPKSATAEIEAYGDRAEGLAATLAASLRFRLKGRHAGAARRAGWPWFALAALALALPLAESFTARGETRAALRALLQRLVGSF